MTIIALFGPTGVGKTELAIAVADVLREQGERPVAVSADALQVYRGLEILTGAADAQDRARLEHRMVSIIDVDQTFSVAQYAQLARREIDDVIASGGRPIVVGGTGLYLRAALAELDLRPPPPPGVRERLMEQLDRDGPERLHQQLTALAPGIAARIDPRDRHRIVRALEVEETGAVLAHPSPAYAPPCEQGDGSSRGEEAARDDAAARGDGNGSDAATAHGEGGKAGDVTPRGDTGAGRGGRSALWTSETRLPTRLVALTMEREQLKRRIDLRVEAMVAAGAREQVMEAERRGASVTARKAVGYRELLDGDVDTMKLRTRQYARRQLTWLRKLPDVEHVDLTDRSDLSAVAREIIAGKDAGSEG